MNDQVTKSETAIILNFAERALAQEGDFVELGCYRGDTSILLGKLLAKKVSLSCNCGKNVEKSDKSVDKESGAVENPAKTVDKMCKTSNFLCKTARRLWIYDSFAGLPAKTSEDLSGAGQNFREGELLVTKREVVNKIQRAGLKNIIVKKAWFNELSPDDLPTKITFAFLDGDLYSSIKVSLQLVAPRLVAGGIILVHDYNNPELPGSTRAVDEFIQSHPEYHLEIQRSLAIIR